MLSHSVRHALELNSKIIGHGNRVLISSVKDSIVSFLTREFRFLSIRQHANDYELKISSNGSNRKMSDSKVLFSTQTEMTSQESETKEEKLKHSDTKLFLKQEMEEFDSVFPLILQDMTFNDFGDSSIQDVLDWQKKVMVYNVPHGKKNRGLAVLTSYKLLAKHSDLVEQNLKLACILGWCVEMVQANFLVIDDVMDQSFTRRGMPCWFRVDGVGLMALNDALLIENGIYYILKKYFQNMPCYVDIIEIFHQMIRYTSFGQCLDMMSTPSGQKPKFELFTEDRYSAIVKYKTAYYSFLLPVKLALCLDDFLDCYGDGAVMGKQGTDIEDGKCSWLIVSALKRASNEQRDVLMNNYGCHDDLSVKKVKEIYDQLDLRDIYMQYEDKMFQELISLITHVSSYQLPAKMFYSFLAVIHKRRR